jgi:plasmid stability protein
MPKVLAQFAHAIRMRDHHRMPKMLQVRNVPEELHRELVRRARARGMTLTDYVREILEREAGRMPREEFFARIHADEPVELDRPVAEIIREERAARGDF